MADRDDVLQLVTHMEWADALVWGTVLQSGPARADDRVRGWLHHIHTVQRAFTAIWQGVPPAMVDLSTFTEVPALAAWGRAAHAGVQQHLASLDEAGLGRPMVMPWASKFVPAGTQPVHPTLAQTVWQVAMHSAHHRGQVNARLRELGAEPPTVDMIAWFWKSRPAPPWPRNVAGPELS